jgi:hypothetical protein
VLANCFRVGLIDEVGPCVPDIGDVAVIGGVVNEETDIVVSCLIGIVMVELLESVVDQRNANVEETYLV